MAITEKDLKAKRFENAELQRKIDGEHAKRARLVQEADNVLEGAILDDENLRLTHELENEKHITATQAGEVVVAAPVEVAVPATPAAKVTTGKGNN